MGEGGQENGCREMIEILALVWRESEENSDKAGLRWYWWYLREGEKINV